ncbi:MAG: hypothetical protein HZA90_03315 [Verrucomicrobia bacterium]|nr:hypothetical protein [Verrucomicrobiota bacterium]
MTTIAARLRVLLLLLGLSLVATRAVVAQYTIHIEIVPGHNLIANISDRTGTVGRRNSKGGVTQDEAGKCSG